MSSVRHFIEEKIKKTGVDEYLRKEFERAGYGGVDMTKTPLGTNIVVYAMRPGIIIGRGGSTIKNLAQLLEEKFDLPNPQISVSEIEIPELNSHVMSSRISSSLKRGVHFRRVGFWSLRQIMESGAVGAEIVISGKLRTERARTEKFREGYVPKSGEPSIRFVRTAVSHVQLKPGILGIRVSIMPPGVVLPDNVELLERQTEEISNQNEDISLEKEKEEVQHTEIKLQEKKEENAKNEVDINTDKEDMGSSN
jgi:small subunit ribosomal protein S3